MTIKNKTTVPASGDSPEFCRVDVEVNDGTGVYTYPAQIEASVISSDSAAYDDFRMLAANIAYIDHYQPNRTDSTQEAGIVTFDAESLVRCLQVGPHLPLIFDTAESPVPEWARPRSTEWPPRWSEASTWDYAQLQDASKKFYQIKAVLQAAGLKFVRHSEDHEPPVEVEIITTGQGTLTADAAKAIGTIVHDSDFNLILIVADKSHQFVSQAGNPALDS